jgi:hypothetical protein
MSGITGTVAENRINEWLRNGGDKNLSSDKEGLKLQRSDDCRRHKTLTDSLGFSDDYVHSKILADNNIKPESIERRLALDRQWSKLQEEIRTTFYHHHHHHHHLLSAATCTNETETHMPTSMPMPIPIPMLMLIDEFIKSPDARDKFEAAIKQLDLFAKKVNEAIISDSMRFNGRSPVQHARRFHFEEKLREALTSTSTNQFAGQK